MIEQVEKAQKAGQKFVNEHPEFKDEVSELFMLMQTEIEEGSSPDAEYESFTSSLTQLLED